MSDYKTVERLHNAVMERVALKTKLGNYQSSRPDIELDVVNLASELVWEISRGAGGNAKHRVLNSSVELCACIYIAVIAMKLFDDMAKELP